MIRQPVESPRPVEARLAELTAELTAGLRRATMRAERVLGLLRGSRAADEQDEESGWRWAA